MTGKQIFRQILKILPVLTLAAALLWGYQKLQDSIPDQLYVFSGEKNPLEELQENPLVSWDEAVTAAGSDAYTVSCSLCGVLPLKTVKVQQIPKEQVMVSGEHIGIYMETSGVLIIDSGQLQGADGLVCEPAAHIVQSGDYIMQINGETLENKKELMEQVAASNGEPMELQVLRREELITLSLTPVKTQDGSYKLGIWVRDNIQGIGTLTFVRQDGSFGALGHGISDTDTGELLHLAQGELYQADLLSINKGQDGNPGELRGSITYADSRKLGTIDSNLENGIYGQLETSDGVPLKPYEIALKQDVTTGPVTILCDVEGEVGEYQAEITEIDWNKQDTNKSFTIHITDPRLLAVTGGIVQGMSGSPVIQNGRLVGAVTHVFIRDSAQGYGIFIENMLAADSL